MKKFLINFLRASVIGVITGAVIGFIFSNFSESCYYFCNPKQGMFYGFIISVIYFLCRNIIVRR